MFVRDAAVEVVEGYYKGQKGVIRGETVDGYLLVMPEHKNGFWAKPNVLKLVEVTVHEV